MSYTLTDAVTALKAQVYWLTRAISFEPLKGLVDGDNKVFHLPYVPAASGTLTIYDPDGATVSSGYTVNSYDTGQITFTTALAETRFASYTAQAFTDTEMSDICTEGFAEMQTRYPRGWYLVSSGGSTYLSTDASTPTEPTVGGVAFNANPVQKKLWHMCNRYALLQRMRERSVVEDHLFKESGRIASMMIDTVQRPKNIAEALADLSKLIDSAVLAAQSNAGDSDSAFGDAVGGAHSDEYLDAYNWWPTSRQGRGLA